jgi:hypothetical protein
MEDNNKTKANIIDLQEKRRAQRQRAKMGRTPGVKPGKISGGLRTGWLSYLQFFLMLAIVAWLMRQC